MEDFLEKCLVLVLDIDQMNIELRKNKWVGSICCEKCLAFSVTVVKATSSGWRTDLKKRMDRFSVKSRHNYVANQEIRHFSLC